MVITEIGLRAKTMNPDVAIALIAVAATLSAVRDTFETGRVYLFSREFLEVGEMMLRYAGERSFIRAFRRWTDATLARWRATQRKLRRKSVAQRGRRMPSTVGS